MAAAEKVTVMVLKVDLQCRCCYKKVKKTICKIPQIRDQVYDEKANTVTIKVMSCCPERVRNKLYSKGGKTIKSIEIKELAKPKEAEKPKTPEKPKQDGPPPSTEKPKEAEKPKVDGPPPSEKPKEPEKPKGDKPKQDAGPPPPSEKPPKEPEKPKGDKPKQDGPPPPEKPKEPKQDGPPPSEKSKDGPKPEPAPNPPAAVAAAKGPEPVPIGVPSVFPYLGPTYDGYGNGPYYQGYGVAPPPARPCYEGYYGYGSGYGRSAYHPGNYYNTEEGSQGCSIM